MSKKPIDILLDRVEWKPLPTTEEPPTTTLPYATHEGLLSLGEGLPTLQCFQLNTGERVVAADDVQKFFGGKFTG